MKTKSIVLGILLLIPKYFYAQKLTYDSSLDSIWSHSAIITQISSNWEWAVINEFSLYKPRVYKISHTRGSHSYDLGHMQSVEISANSKLGIIYTQDSELKILNLLNGKYTDLGKASKYKLADGKSLLAFINEVEDRKELIIKDLETGRSMKVIGINDFVWNPIKNNLVAVRSNLEKIEILNIQPFIDIKIIKDCFKCTYSELKWDEKGESLIFVESDENGNNKISIKDSKNNLKSISDSIILQAFPDYRIRSSNFNISEDGRKVLFYRQKIRNEGTHIDEVEIWDTNDPSNQLRELSKVDILLTLWNTDTGDVLSIEDNKSTSSLVHPDFNFGVILKKRYDKPVYDQYRNADVFLVDLNSGERKLIVENLFTDENYFSISPKGKYIAYFKKNNWWLYDIKNNSTLNLTEKLSVNWTHYLELRTANPKVVERVFWSEDENYVLLHDRNDIWKIGINGKQRVRLTKGREENISYKIFYQIRNAKVKRSFSNCIGLAYDLNNPILLTMNSDKLKTGLSMWNSDNGVRTIYLEQNKTDNIFHDGEENIIFSQHSLNVSPHFYHLNLSTLEKQLFHEVNPTLKNYDLGEYEIFNYTVNDKENLNGVLIYPAQFDSLKKYPMIVWPYERNSLIVNKFRAPTARDPLNFDIYKFILNGYFVLLPDIVYEVGNPGFSALACVEEAVSKTLELNSSIDKDKLGLYGFSFGGYEAAFIATQTNLFKAVVAGAAATDLVSLYHDNYWEHNRPQAWRFESQQFRMGDSFYKMKENYLKNSPLFHVEKIETPLLLWTGKLDGNINWYQSVFMFNAMKRLNKTGKLIIFNDDDHSLVKPVNQERLSKEVYDWFEFYLKKH